MPPRVRSTLDSQSSNWYREQLYTYEQSIIRLELLISGVSRICQRAEDPQNPRDERFISLSRSILTCYESQLTRIHLIRTQLLEGFQAVE